MPIRSCWSRKSRDSRGSELVALVWPTGWALELVTVAFGLVIGSFVNVVIHRLPRGASVVRPRSRCPSCGATLRWFENVPLLSFALQRGRCRRCRAPISARYPVVEALTALVFLAALRRYGPSWVLVGRDLPFLAALVAVAFIDLEHRIIPDEISLGGCVFGLVWAFAQSLDGGLAALGAAAGGFGFFAGFGWAYERLTGRRGLGGGDVKFIAMVGAVLGPYALPVTILVGSVLGSLIGGFWALVTRKGGTPATGVMKTAVPFGPFLVVGALTHYFWGDWLWLRFMTPI